MKYKTVKITAIWAVFILSAHSGYADILRAPPGNPDPKRCFLFYLHGRIVEGSDGRPISPDFGPYEYHTILEAFSEKDFIVISEIRPSNSDVTLYSLKVVRWISGLIEKGVPPREFICSRGIKGRDYSCPGFI